MSLVAHIRKSQARFKRIRTKGPDTGTGEFFLEIDITSSEDTYIPLSIASGKKPAGFVYQIEGTSEGTLSTTNLSCKGTGITQLTVGTLLYAKIPAEKTATFRILIEIKGSIGHTYRIILSRINYKRNPEDARYQKYEADLGSDTLKFT